MGLPCFGNAQDWIISTIPDSIRKDAHAVIRSNKESFIIDNKLQVKTFVEQVITSFNKIGDKVINTVIPYNPYNTINNCSIEVYDEHGKLIERFKNKDFRDVSYVTSGQLYSDERIKYVNFVPVKYPYTLVLKYDVSSKNTLIHPFFPIKSSKVGVEQVTYEIINSSESRLLIKEQNFKDYDVQRHASGNKIEYKLSNLKPFEVEELQGNFKKNVPYAEFSLENFNFYGEQGQFNDWHSYGIWYYNLIKDKNDFTEKERSLFQGMVKNASSNEEKVKILYKYLQETKRYEGVQLGIGGFVPYSAKYVHDKGYGDCKALATYMKSMLETVGIPSYYTVVEAGSKEDFYKDFSSIAQGNHVILMVPNGQDTIWLETTNMKQPFNYLGTFTYDRWAAIIRPEGGKLVKTQSLENKSVIINTVESKILDNGQMEIKAVVDYNGLYYEWMDDFKDITAVKQKEAIVKLFNIKNVNEISDYKYEKNWENASCQLITQINTTNIVSKQSDYTIFPAIINYKFLNTLKKSSERKKEIVLDKPYKYKYENKISLDKAQVLENGNIEKNIKTKFGEYRLVCKQVTPNTIEIFREINIPQGTYAPSDYKEFSNFINAVNIAENTKIILK